MAAKPTVVIVPGAFHPDTCLARLTEQLGELGYETETTTLRSVGTTASVRDDASHLVNDILQPLLNRGQDVFLVLHSYAGFPGSVAAKGLGKADREARGLKGGIVGLAFLCAFVPQEGVSLFNQLGGAWAPWHRLDEAAGVYSAHDPVNVFYQDVEPGLARECAALLKGQSLRTSTEPAPPLGFADAAYDGRRAYIRCLQDQALPLFLQDQMVEQSGVQWLVLESDTGHSPFLVDPRALAATLHGLVGKFAEAP